MASPTSSSRSRSSGSALWRRNNELPASDMRNGSGADGQPDWRMTLLYSESAARSRQGERRGEGNVDNMLTHEPGARPGGVTFIAVLVDFAGLITVFVVILGLLGLTSPQIQSRHADIPAVVA